MTRRAVGVVAIALALAVFALAAAASAAGSALTVADLSAYRDALSGKGKEGALSPPAPVRFRELWDRPGAYQGRRVQVRGRLVRRFRQGAFGTFPPLEEAWVVSPEGNPFCLVFPATPGEAKPKPKPSGQVRFSGTFLRMVHYEGGDGTRLAPLIVGPDPPVAASVAVAVAMDRSSTRGPVAVRALTRMDWAIGLAAAVVVALVLARQHLRRPSRYAWDVDGARAPVFDDANGEQRLDTP